MGRSERLFRRHRLDNHLRADPEKDGPLRGRERALRHGAAGLPHALSLQRSQQHVGARVELH